MGDASAPEGRERPVNVTTWSPSAPQTACRASAKEPGAQFDSRRARRSRPRPSVPTTGARPPSAPQTLAHAPRRRPPAQPTLPRWRPSATRCGRATACWDRARHASRLAWAAAVASHLRLACAATSSFAPAGGGSARPPAPQNAPAAVPHRPPKPAAHARSSQNRSGGTSWAGTPPTLPPASAPSSRANTPSPRRWAGSSSWCATRARAGAGEGALNRAGQSAACCWRRRADGCH
jgi:hypothetical protein